MIEATCYASASAHLKRCVLQLVQSKVQSEPCRATVKEMEAAAVARQGRDKSRENYHHRVRSSLDLSKLEMVQA